MIDGSELPLLPLGFAVGMFGTIVGAGGGFLLVPILLLLYPDTPADELTSISLAVVCANAISGSLAYGRQRRTDYKSALVFGMATLPGAVAGAIAVGFIPRRTFDAMFATILGALGVFLAVRSPRTAIVPPVTGRWTIRRVIRDRQGHTFAYSYRLPVGIGLSVGVGFLSSLLGIGGGVVHVPLMIWALHFPVHIATATSQFVLMVTAAEGTGVHLLSGTLDTGDTGMRALVLAAGAIPGAQVGAQIARRIRGSHITRLLAVSLILVAIRLGLKAARIA